MVVAYLRVSTGHQLIENQRGEIEKYADSHGMTVDRWVTEVVSGSTRGCDRKLGRLLRQLKPGDTLIITELSRLSRTLMDIMSIVSVLLKKKVNLYSTKDGCTFDDTINSKVLLFAFGLVAEIERNLISMRTREALAIRKENGMVLGRRKGSCVKMDVLKRNSDDIRRRLDAGETAKSICETYGVSYTTLRKFRNIIQNGT